MSSMVSNKSAVEDIDLDEKKEKYHIRLAWIFFIIYMIFLMYFLFFAEITGRTYVDRDYHYNLVPFREIKRFIRYRESLGWFAVGTNLFGNVIAFLPYGAILPILIKKSRNFFRITLYSFEFSLFVEIVQLVSKVGSFDVDDLFLNTLGGAIGYLIFLLICQFGREKYEKTKKTL